MKTYAYRMKADDRQRKGRPISLYRHKSKMRVSPRGGMTISVVCMENKVCVGVAVCSAGDYFQYDTGKGLSELRAHMAFDVPDDEHEMYHKTQWVYISPDETGEFAARDLEVVVCCPQDVWKDKWTKNTVMQIAATQIEGAYS